MKKLLALFCLALVCLTSSATNKGGIADSANVLKVKVLPASDIARIPVQVEMENPTVPMTCVQCYLQVSDTTALFCKDGEEKGYMFSRTPRWTSSHNAMLAWNTKKHPNTLMVMVISTKSRDFEGNTGGVVTVYLDGSKLKNGKYTVSLVSSNMVWTDRRAVKTYYTPDTDTVFYIKNGKLVLK